MTHRFQPLSFNSNSSRNSSKKQAKLMARKSRCWTARPVFIVTWAIFTFMLLGMLTKTNYYSSVPFSACTILSVKL
ncbi:uncharacterized protein DC041_0008515 [Schistosoma bovis]|uniref:Uncharacterized protein n=1 Tax=Schistosoma bovis TaxID=6184 RepID=A0A430QNM7_SCHBO|nr:uncharacterized protein DC041_0008515 [Schistosoma bovis]